MNLKAYLQKLYLELLGSIRNAWHSPLASLRILPLHSSPLATPWLKVGKLIDKSWFSRLSWRLGLTIYQSSLHMLQICWQDLSNNNRHVKYVDGIVKTAAAKHEAILNFTKALIVNPRATGAAIPSSRRLAREMAAHINVEKPGLIVELGAGTGVVTEALLKRGIAPSRIIAVELVPELARSLRLRYPEIQVLQGDATHLQTLLKDHAGVNAVVSSLPLRSLPKSVTQAILSQIHEILPPEGRYIQFTYSYRANRFESLQQYRSISSKRVWINIPPARVDVIEKA